MADKEAPPVKLGQSGLNYRQQCKVARSSDRLVNSQFVKWNRVTGPMKNSAPVSSHK